MIVKMTKPMTMAVNQTEDMDKNRGGSATKPTKGRIKQPLHEQTKKEGKKSVIKWKSRRDIKVTYVIPRQEIKHRKVTTMNSSKNASLKGNTGCSKDKVDSNEDDGFSFTKGEPLDTHINPKTF